MSSRISSILEDGGSGVLIDVECHLSNSLPNIIIVGIANKAVDEAKERIRGAFASSKIKLPKKRITLNLAPADIPKEGSSFDLPMVVAILKASEIIKFDIPKDQIILGEIGLDGRIRPIRGIISKILSAKALGINRFWIPAGNLDQAKLIPDIYLYPVKSLKTLYSHLTQPVPLDFIKTNPKINIQETNLKDTDTDFNDIVGQMPAKRAMVIAAAGHHNILLDGPPGTGKSMLAKALPSILPKMTQKEILEVTHLYSLSSKNFDNIVFERPIRAPHHSASHVAIVGGGQKPAPGEISLSHQGVLFLDEFPEFNRTAIESLRQPLEDHKITVSRARGSIDFPANFILVGTANPCPCGYFGSNRECTCLLGQIQKYQKKISGPVIDRIDLYISVEEVPHHKILNKSSTNHNATKEMAELVASARDKQLSRSGKLNNLLTNKELLKYAQLDKETADLFNKASKEMGLSGRSYVRALKVARTIADLENKTNIDINHISEALQYRKKDILL